ncbi:hypothetical protein GGI1_05635 [Acidithiobacillus sp. GGI-221]|nr:hypothetical protein GGI1_05635 [Acidithiobacillus sp. GGI-221]
MCLIQIFVEQVRAQIRQFQGIQAPPRAAHGLGGDALGR